MCCSYPLNCCINGNWNIFPESTTEIGAQSRLAIVVSRVRASENDLVTNSLICNPIYPVFPWRVPVHGRWRRGWVCRDNRTRISWPGPALSRSRTANGNGSCWSCCSFGCFFGPWTNFSAVLKKIQTSMLYKYVFYVFNKFCLTFRCKSDTI